MEMSYQIVWGGIESLLCALVKKYFAKDNYDILDTFALLYSHPHSATEGRKMALVVCQKMRNGIAHHATGDLPSYDALGAASRELVSWFREAHPLLTDPLSNLSSYYSLALCLPELCDRLAEIERLRQNTSYSSSFDEELQGNRTEDENAAYNSIADNSTENIRSPGLSAESKLFVPSQFDPPPLQSISGVVAAKEMDYVYRGTLNEIKKNPRRRQHIKGRNIVILDGKHAFCMFLFLRWNGNSVKLKNVATGGFLSVSTKRTVGVLRKN